jgi:hypothetical protein
MSGPTPLPMAIAGCGLDAAGLREQADRYRRLGAVASGTERVELKLTLQFAAAPEPALLEETIKVERGCCSFFEIAYDEPRRRLSLAVADPSRRAALDPIQRLLER